MLFGIYFFIIICNLICWYLKKDFKALKILSFFICWYILIGDPSIADYSNYRQNYYNPVDVHFYISDPLYKLLVYVSNQIGLTYEMFRILLCMGGLLLVVYSLYDMRCNFHYFYACYLSMSVFMDMIQIRNFISFSIMIFSMRYLLCKDKKSNCKWVIGMTVAYLMHSMSILYIAIGIMLKFFGKYEKYIKYIMLILLGITLVLANGTSFNYIITHIPFISATTIRRYLSTRTRFGFLIPMIFQSINYWYMSVCYQMKRKNNLNDEKNELIKKLYIISILGFIYVPLYVININFYRYIRGMILLGILATSKVQDDYQVKSKKRIEIAGIMFFNICVWLLYEIIFNNLLDVGIIPIFCN